MMQSTIKWSFTICSTALVLAGCETVSTDPREGGFLGGVKGVSTGAYDQRIQDRENALSTLDSIERSLNTAIQQDLETVTTIERRINLIQVRHSDLKLRFAEFERLNSQREVLSQDIIDVKQRIASIERSIVEKNRILRQRTEAQSIQEEIEQQKADKEDADAINAEFQSLVEDFESLQEKSSILPLQSSS